MKFTPEQIAKAKSAKNAEELLAMAQESGIELTAEEAAKFFADLKCEGELADDELDNISGGCGDKPSYYYYEDVVGKRTLADWPPLCNNDLGLSKCGDCGGFNVGYWYCTGQHYKK